MTPNLLIPLLVTCYFLPQQIIVISLSLLLRLDSYIVTVIIIIAYPISVSFIWYQTICNTRHGGLWNGPGLLKLSKVTWKVVFIKVATFNNFVRLTESSDKDVWEKSISGDLIISFCVPLYTSGNNYQNIYLLVKARLWALHLLHGLLCTAKVWRPVKTWE